jgi:hypothetical protein
MAGLGSCRELAEKYGTTRYAVQNRCKREEWRLQMAKLDGEVAQETTRIIANRADEILAMRQQVMGQTLEDATFLRGLMMRAIPLMEANDVRSLKDLAGIYRIITEQPRKVLGMDRQPVEAEEEKEVWIKEIHPILKNTGKPPNKLKKRNPPF